jgi:NAD(P)-dependent dehydrogenase (short-subunit alcohol dehydrogenase family)
MGRLEGKVAFITGGGAGIAKATAIAFSKEGAKVGIAEINRDLGRAAERAIREAGGEALFVEADVTDDAALKRAIDATVALFGQLNVLMNCAGGSLQEDVPVHRMDPDVWDRTIALNLRHPFLSCRHGIPHMLESGGGSIINFSSWLGLMGSEKPAYAACKGGIVSFTKTLAAEYMNQGIRANAIAPGTVRTERSIKRWENKDMLLSEKPSPQVRARLAVRNTYPFSVGEASDIASIAVFLASDESRMLTGTVLPADGGRSACFKPVLPDE